MNGEPTFPVVGIGASAGSVEALEGFFKRVPHDVDAAFVVVTHLNPERESLLHQVIARFTPLGVKVAEDGMAVEARTVYVMPSHATLGIHGGQLKLHEVAGRRERKPIDVFLSALAVDMHERSAGVILSGGDADGTLGLKAIKEHGGLTFAQVHDGFGPQHPDMPDSAILSGLVDFALPAQEIGEKITQLTQAPSSPAGGKDAGTQGTLEESIHAALPAIYGVLRVQADHDFSGYKTPTFIRRVQRRMHIVELTNVEDYVSCLREDSREVDALFRDLLINVTNFFRDAEAFEALASQVMPRLLENRDSDDTLRIWIPACATGEEAYSLAILVREQLNAMKAERKVQIFATDIDDRALSVARAGRYPKPLLANVSPERQRRFFTQDGESFVITKEIRDLCVFSPHSVIRDPPFSHIDLVSCRNLLIYFGTKVQSQVIPTFHYALRPGGFLFLGTAESAAQFGDLFASVDKRNRIFQRRPSSTSIIPIMPLRQSSRDDGHGVSLVPRRNTPTGLALRQLVDQQILGRFAPAHVVVNHDGDVVYFSSGTGKYLETPAGSPTRQLMMMARRELRFDIRTLFRKCLENGKPADSTGIAIDVDARQVQLVDLHIEPLAEHPPGEPLFLVSFVDHGPMVEHDGTRQAGAANGATLAIERELHETRERLQSVIEEYEAAIEEQKSSNEELVSVNEELQSTNEELESSKEELQSLNEELHTVNVELSGKVDALDRANSDLVNLFESTNVATVFLDHHLVIRSFTPAVTAVFNIRPSDLGRPITDLTGRFDLGMLGQDIASVFGGGTPTERRVSTSDGYGHYLLRVAPYQTSDSATSGVVITFLDLTTLIRSEARQQLLIAELQHRTRNLLTLVQSIAQKTLGDVPQVEHFASRLAALGRVQELLGGKLDDAIDLRDIVRLELTALCLPADRVTTDGPEVRLGFDAVQTFSLALHELGTNALKHGAFAGGNHTGRLDLTWGIDATLPVEHLVLEWIESGVSIHPVPTQRGFGSELLERALPYTLRASTKVVFRPDGLTCRIDMPLPTHADKRIRAPEAAA